MNLELIDPDDMSGVVWRENKKRPKTLSDLRAFLSLAASASRPWQADAQAF